MVKTNKSTPLQPPSCKECQRRKQKCSKEWPCQQCTARKVPHLCKFGEKKNVSDLTDEGIRAAVSRKRSNADVDDSSAQSSETLLEEKTGLISWGYMSDNKLFEMEKVVNQDEPASQPDAPFIQADALESVLRNVPTRTITDVLVQNYLYSTNFRYYWIYPPTFTKAYSDWWEGRQSRQSLSPDFTCLLLRLCAVSTQHLSDDLRVKIEYEFAEDYETIGKRYFDAADKLNATLLPATCTIARAQQLMLKASWYKAEGMPLETWHAVGEGVRAAQELGMHYGIDAQNLDEFETEMRKRLWCTLYIWDWQMSAWLNRPLIIDHSTCKLELPTLKLEVNDAYPGLPSPFTHMALQAELIQTLSKELREFTEDTKPIERVQILQDRIGSWMTNLPAAYSMTEADGRYDEEFPYLILQRLQLHSCAWMLKMDSFKSFLTRDLPDDATEIEHEYRKQGIQCALKLHEATDKLYNFEHPINTKFHLVSFLLLDVGLLFCSAMFHDKRKDLPCRPQVLRAIEKIISTFYLIGETTQSGKNAYKFLSKLASRLQLQTGESIHENMVYKRRKVHDNTPIKASPPTTSPSYSDQRGSTSSHDSKGSMNGSESSESITLTNNGNGSNHSVEEVPSLDEPKMPLPARNETISDFEKHFHPIPVPNPMPPDFSLATDIPISAINFSVPTITNLDLGGVEQIIGYDQYDFNLAALGTTPGWLYDSNDFPGHSNLW